MESCIAIVDVRQNRTDSCASVLQGFSRKSYVIDSRHLRLMSQNEEENFGGR